MWDKVRTLVTDRQLLDFLEIAHGWLTDSVRGKLVIPSNASDATYLWKLAEANYAIYLIGTSIATDDGLIENQVQPFFAEAYRILLSLRTSADTGAGMQEGPKSSSTDIEPVFTRGKYDADGILIGNKMGIKDGLKGSLDDW